MFDVEGDPRSSAVEARLWEIAAQLVRAAPPDRPGDFNEALIELGALVCTPAAPDCPGCPVRAHCLAYGRGTVALRPAARAKPATPYYDVVAAVVTDAGGKVLIIRRLPHGLLGGLWGFPGGTVGADEDLADAVARTVCEQTGVVVRAGGVLRTVRHAYTHFRITLHAFSAALEAGDAQARTCAEVRWVDVDELEEYAMPVTDRKVARALGS